MTTDSSNPYYSAEQRATRLGVIKLLFDHVNMGDQGDPENRKHFRRIANSWVEWIETGSIEQNDKET